MQIVIKHFSELELDELYQILQLRNKVFVVEQNCIYQDTDGKDKDAFHLFFKENDKIVAYARIFKPGDYFDKTSIGRVVVSPSYRNKNYGKKLMQEAILFVTDVLKENTIKISAQSYLEKFYRDLGFIPVGKEYLEDGIPHRKMIYNKK